jgi:hypothetical protein
MLKQIHYLLKTNQIKKVVVEPSKSKNHKSYMLPIITSNDIPKQQNKLIKELIINEGTLIIENNAFEKLKVKKIIFPETLETINNNITEECKFLKEIVFKGDNLLEIGVDAFRNTDLKKVKLPESITNIKRGAFSQCEKLKEINIPQNLKIIPGSFLLGTKVKKIELPPNLLKIEYLAFASTELKEVKIPHSVEILGSNVFSRSKVKKISIGPNLKDIDKDFLTNKHSIRTIEIDYPNQKKELKKYTIKSFIFPINKITTNENGYVVYKKPITIGKQKIFTSFDIINKDGIININTTKLLKILDKKNYQAVNNYEEVANKIPRWLDAMEKRKRGKQQVYLPHPSIIKGLSTDSREIVRYFLKEKEFNDVANLFKNKHSDEQIVKMCYHLGLFSDKKEESERAYEFLINKLSKEMNFIDINLIFENINPEIKYNRHFAKFYIENFVNSKTFRVENNDYTARMLVIFKEIHDTLKNYKKEITKEEVIRYMSNQKFEHRPGNEVLAMTLTPYANYYTQRDFDKMQDLYEKSKNQTKLIHQTKDQSETGMTYLWSPAENPINFVLGHEDKADCCAKLKSAAEPIMIAAIKDPEVQNLIIFDGFKNIIGKATAYYNPIEKYIVFNTAEINRKWFKNAGELEREEALNTIVRASKDQANEMNKNETKITKITIGMKFNRLESEIKKGNYKIIKDKDALANHKYDGYNSDANSEKGQAVLYELKK